VDLVVLHLVVEHQPLVAQEQTILVQHNKVFLALHLHQTPAEQVGVEVQVHQVIQEELGLVDHLHLHMVDLAVMVMQVLLQMERLLLMLAVVEEDRITILPQLLVFLVEQVVEVQVVQHLHHLLDNLEHMQLVEAVEEELVAVQSHLQMVVQVVQES
jgi:hypothetical protein